jgi:molybdate transport system substrate-binding protein
MKPERTISIVAVALWLLLAGSTPARAADIRVLCSNGYRAVMQDLVPQFQATTPDKIVVTYDLSAALARRIEAGEPFDVAILTPALIDGLATRGLVTSDSRVALAVSPIGLAIRRGTAKPELRPVEALRRTLLGSTSIAYAKEGAAAGFFLALVQQLGLVETLKDRIVPSSSGVAVGASVAKGEVEYGVIPVSEIMPIAGIEVGGTFPTELGSFITMTSGVSRTSNHAAAAHALVTFLTGPQAVPVLRQRGMEPPR